MIFQQERLDLSGFAEENTYIYFFVCVCAGEDGKNVFEFCEIKSEF